jgi:hypothetical protein
VDHTVADSTEEHDADHRDAERSADLQRRRQHTGRRPEMSRLDLFQHCG